MIRQPNAFNEALPANFDGVFEWDFLKEAFMPTKIEPMDIDAIVERRMRFLAFETKSDGAPIPKGQRITLENLVRTGFFTIIVTRGKTARTIKGWEVWRRESGAIVKEAHEGNAEALKDQVKDWFCWANGGAAA